MMIYFLVFILISLQAFSSPSPRELLAQSQARFDQGQYENALSLLQSLDVRTDFDNSEDMLMAFKIRAISYVQSANPMQARETIRELLFIDPTYKFDPFDTPKAVVELAEQEFQEIAEKNHRLALARGQAPGQISPQIVEKVIMVEKKPPFLSSLLPFGLNHYYVGSPIKGSIYMSLQAASLLANIGAFWWKQSYLEKFGSPHLLHQGDRSRFNAAQQTQYIALGTLIAALTVSIIDAMIFFPSDLNSTGNF